MCGIKSRNGWVLLGLLLLALPVFCWAKGSVEESNVELTSGKPSESIETPEKGLWLSNEDLIQIENSTDELEASMIKREKALDAREQDLIKREKALDAREQVLITSETLFKERKIDNEILVLDNEKLRKILNKTVPSVAIPTGIGIFLIGGLLGGLIHSALPASNKRGTK